MRLRLLTADARRAEEANSRVFVIEGHRVCSTKLRRGIEECGFSVNIAARGRRELDRLARSSADAVILNLDVADSGGIDLLLGLRQRGVVAPVLVVTSRSTAEWRGAAFDAGADDCLVHPLAMAELVARLRARLRRCAPRATTTHFGDLELESHRRAVRAGMHTIILSPLENGILRHLVSRGCHVSSRREILREVFGYDFDPGTNVVQVHIAHLRRKLAGCETRIENVRGVGYRLRTVTADDGNAS